MSFVKLTLSCPAALAEQVTELLLDSRWADGFTTLAGAGHGADFATATARERVRGCVDVVLMMVVLPPGHVAPLLAQLRENFHAPGLRYWTEAVQDFGELA